MGTYLEKLYRVKTTSVVTLKIEIGYAQKGYTTVFLGDKKIVNNKKNSFEKVLEEKGKDLKGKTLFCQTMVTDVRTETNETSVKYELTGGRKDFKQKLQESVESHGDVKHYVANITFY